jgi:hypothetical protein
MHCCKRAVTGRSSTAHRLDEAFDADTIRRSPSGVDARRCPAITQRTFSRTGNTPRRESSGSAAQSVT